MIDFEKFKAEFDADLQRLTDEELIAMLKAVGMEFEDECDLCGGSGFIQPKGQRTQIYCWKCNNKRATIYPHS